MDCPICYDSVLTSIEKCPACKNAFHAICLLSWLKGHTTCPVCRALMRSGRDLNDITEFIYDANDEIPSFEQIKIKIDQILYIFDTVIFYQDSDYEDLVMELRKYLSNSYNYYLDVNENHELHYVISKNMEHITEPWETDFNEENTIAFESLNNNQKLIDLLYYKEEFAKKIKYIDFGHDGVIDVGENKYMDRRTIIDAFISQFPNLSTVMLCGYYCSFTTEFENRGIREIHIW